MGPGARSVADLICSVTGARRLTSDVLDSLASKQQRHGYSPYRVVTVIDEFMFVKGLVDCQVLIHGCSECFPHPCNAVF